MALLKKYVIPLTPHVMELLASRIDPRTCVKPVLMEVEQPPSPKDFIMDVPSNAGFPADISDDAWKVIIGLEGLGLTIKGVAQPKRNDQIICDEILFEGRDGFRGWATIWREDSGHSSHDTTAWCKTLRGHIDILTENSSTLGGKEPARIVRIIGYAYTVILPKIEFLGVKAGARTARQMRDTFVSALLKESISARDFIMGTNHTKEEFDKFSRYERNLDTMGFRHIGGAQWIWENSKFIVYFYAHSWPGAAFQLQVYKKGQSKMLENKHYSGYERGQQALDDIAWWLNQIKSVSEGLPLTPAEDLAASLILESPQFKTLKQKRKSLSPEEKKRAGDAPIWKAEVNGATWYVSNTHRCYQAHKSISAAVTAYWDVVEPSG